MNRERELTVSEAHAEVLAAALEQLIDVIPPTESGRTAIRIAEDLASYAAPLGAGVDQDAYLLAAIDLCRIAGRILTMQLTQTMEAQ